MSAKRRRRLLGIESLEGRRVLSASPWAAPPQAAAIHELPSAPFAAPPTPSVTAVKSVSIVETMHHGPAVLLTGEIVPVSMPGGPVGASGLGAIERPRSVNGSGAWQELGILARAELAAPPRSVTLVANPAQPPYFDAAASALRATTSALFAPGPPAEAVQHDRSLPLIVVLADRGGTDNSSVRLLFWMSQMVPQGVLQGLAQGYAQFDLRGRFTELMHDTLGGHLSEGTRSATDGGSSDEAVPDGRHPAINPALFGQSGKTDSMFAGAGRGVGETLPSFNLQLDDAGGTLTREAVGPLVALGDATAVWAAAWAANSRALGGEGDASAVDLALHELLAPRFAFDAAALGEAMRDLVSEADDLGVSLLGFLTDPAPHSEIAIVAGVAAALAYRNWRRRERREEAESRAMLEARFVTGPASLRLGRRTAS